MENKAHSPFHTRYPPVCTYRNCQSPYPSAPDKNVKHASPQSSPDPTMQLPWLLISLALATHGAIVIVPPGNGTLGSALNNAAPGDTLQLESGEYWEVSGLTLVKGVTILGANTTLPSDPPSSVLSVDSRLASYALQAGFYEGISLGKLAVRDRGANTECSLAEPMALEANFSIMLSPAPVIRSNMVFIQALLGPWYSTRTVGDLHFGTCMYSVDGEENNASNFTMKGRSYSVSASTCSVSVSWAVKFDKLINCGAVKTTYPKLVDYKLAVQVLMAETVTMATPTKYLRTPTLRTANAATNLRYTLLCIAYLTVYFVV